MLNILRGIADIADFRDPKVFEYQGSYYAVVASKTPDDRGQILLFASSNLIDWTFTSLLLEGEKGKGLCGSVPISSFRWQMGLDPVSHEMERQQKILEHKFDGCLYR